MTSRSRWIVVSAVGAVLISAELVLYAVHPPASAGSSDVASARAVPAVAPATTARAEDSVAAQRTETTPAHAELPLRGRVVDRRGEPVAESRVTFFGRDETSLASVAADAHGHFEWRDEHDAAIALLADAPGFGETTLRAPFTLPLEITLIERSESMVVEGVVRDERGSPIRTATISASGRKSGDELTSLLDGERTIDGTFRVTLRADAGVKDLCLGASADGFRSGLLDWFPFAPDTERRGLLITLRAANGNLAGRVVDETGLPIAGAQVVPFLADGRQRDGITTNQRGEFTDASVGETAIAELFATKSGFAPVRLLVGELAAGVTFNDVTIRMHQHGATLRGRVIDSRGGSVAGALVRLFLAEGPPLNERWHRETTSSADGSYEFRDVPDEPGFVAVVDDRRVLHGWSAVELPSEGVVAQDLIGGGGATITGVLTLDVSNDAVCDLELRPLAELDAKARAVLKRDVRIGESFVLHDVEATAYRLRLWFAPDHVIEREVGPFADRLDLGTIAITREEFFGLSGR